MKSHRFAYWNLEQFDFFLQSPACCSRSPSVAAEPLNGAQHCRGSSGTDEKVCPGHFVSSKMLLPYKIQME